MAVLGSLVEQIRGVSYKPEDLHSNLNANSIMLLRANNIRDDMVNFDEVVYVDRKKVSDKQLLKAGDILICTSSGSKELVGKAAYITEDIEATFGAFCKVVRPRSKCAKYIGHFFCSPIYRERIANVAGGANINNIRNEHIDELTIPLPALAEQENIAALLDSVTALISLRKLQIAKLDELVKSRFVELMDSAELSDELTVEQITERVKVGFVGTCEKYYTDETGIPMLRTGNITDHGVDMRDLKYVTADFHEKNKKSQIRRGDLLIARHGSNGQANVYDGPEAQCLNAVVIVPNQTAAKSVFLAGLINSPAVKEQIDRTLVGSTQHVVNTKSIANLVVRIPCLEVQEQYEAFVEQTDKSKLAVQQSLAQLETLKKSLMQRYFG
ncbi:MAG: restriction endonuclease subunit S [Clostridia bacterium]|nr:restriction endonuclease subunit S [Clostridia bacterium]